MFGLNPFGRSITFGVILGRAVVLLATTGIAAYGLKVLLLRLLGCEDGCAPASLQLVRWVGVCISLGILLVIGRVWIRRPLLRLLESRKPL
jgi:hypothetical protein